MARPLPGLADGPRSSGGGFPPPRATHGPLFVSSVRGTPTSWSRQLAVPLDAGVGSGDPAESLHTLPRLPPRAGEAVRGTVAPPSAPILDLACAGRDGSQVTLLGVSTSLGDSGCPLPAISWAAVAEGGGRAADHISRSLRSTPRRRRYGHREVRGSFRSRTPLASSRLVSQRPLCTPLNTLASRLPCTLSRALSAPPALPGRSWIEDAGCLCPAWHIPRGLSHHSWSALGDRSWPLLRLRVADRHGFP